MPFRHALFASLRTEDLKDHVPDSREWLTGVNQMKRLPIAAAALLIAGGLPASAGDTATIHSKLKQGARL